MKNISKWILGVLALIIAVIAVFFYWKGIPETYPWKVWFDSGRIGEEPATPFTNLQLNWSYILIILGIVIALISVIFTAVIKGVNVKTLLIAVVAFAIIVAGAYFMSRSSFLDTEMFYAYSGSELVETIKGTDGANLGKTINWVEIGINFFILTFGAAILSILFSVVYKAVKR